MAATPTVLELGKTPSRWRWPRRLALALLIIATCWVVAINAWLRFLGEQTISRRPEKLQVTYRQAWSVLPGHLHVRGLRLSAQTRRNQWQLDIDQATFHLNLRQLLRREFMATGLRGSGVSFRLRNRPKAGLNLASEGAFFPPIAAYELSTAEPRPPPDLGPQARSPWHISLADIDLTDVRELWFDRIRVAADANTSRASGSMDVVMRGAFSLQDVVLHLADASIILAGQPAADQLTLDSKFSLQPTISRKLREPATFAGLSGQIAAQAQVANLAFLQTLLPANQKLDLEGSGTLQGNVAVKNGEVLQSSFFKIKAPHLRADVGALAGEGDGELSAVIEKTQSGRKLTLRVALKNVKIGTAAQSLGLARAKNFNLVFEGHNPQLGSALQNPRILVELPALQIPSLIAFDDLVPKGLGISIIGGSAVAVTRIELTQGSERSEFELRADHAQLLFRGIKIEGALQVAGRTEGNRATRSLSLEGVKVKFRGTTRPTKRTVPSAPVAFELHLENTQLRLPPPGATIGRGLRLASGAVKITGTVDDLAWWETPIKGVDWLRLRGQADLLATLHLVGSGRSTRLGAPSRLQLTVPELDAGLGTWRARSSGALLGELFWSKGEIVSRLSVQLDRATVGQKATEPLHLPSLHLVASGPSLARGLDVAGVRLELSAEPTTIPDLSALTPYLPEDRLVLTGGQGTLQGKLHLTKKDLSANVRLQSGAANIELLGNPVSAAIDLDAHLRSESTHASAFSVQGTTLRLTNVDFPDLEGQSEAWWAVLNIGEGNLIIGRPLQIDARVKLQLRDTEPIVHLVGESQRTVRWLSRLLEVQNVTGTARMILNEKGLRFQDLLIKGDGLEIRGRIYLEDQTSALLLVQLHGLRAGFEILGDWRDVKVLRPAAWFEKRTSVWNGDQTN